jgi:hypothetical protein
VNGPRMHYVDEGPADAPPVLLLHGNPAWGFLSRDVVAALLDAGPRVVVPDQIGFGLSEKPYAHGVHTLDNHTANLVALLDALDLRGVTFVCHDWGGPDPRAGPHGDRRRPARTLRPLPRRRRPDHAGTVGPLAGGAPARRVDRTDLDRIRPGLTNHQIARNPVTSS